jgi:single-strand DNA-binding protein
MVLVVQDNSTMASFNRVILVGNMTRSPELRHIPSGQAVTEIGLAVNNRRKSPSGELIDEVTFVDITLWGREAEIVCQYLSKGSPLLVEGRLKLDTWESEGQKRSKLRVIGERITMLGSGGGNRNENENGGYSQGYSQRQSTSRSSSSPSRSQQDYYDAPDAGDDVPF